ncbi:MAG TPA: glycerophosphodiester phosphodiesterase family protein [Chitinophagaceae bacterium]
MALPLSLLLATAVAGQASLPASFPKFLKEGHRGARGLMPENTIPSMYKALETGANTLEVDVYLTADKKVVVAHDPFVNVQISRLADGSDIPPQDARKYVWHQMKYDDIRKIDVGLKPFKAFPGQQKIAAYMPLLDELIDSVEAFAAAKGLPKPIYSIEFKTQPANAKNKFNAPPPVLSEAVLKIVKSRNIGDRFLVKSFDMRPLQYLHKRHPEVVVAYLADRKRTLQENIDSLGFVPHIYSPNQGLVTKELVAECKAKGIKIIPWTINSKEVMRSFIAMGVDGIITDFPNYFSEFGL